MTIKQIIIKKHQDDIAENRESDIIKRFEIILADKMD